MSISKYNHMNITVMNCNLSTGHKPDRLLRDVPIASQEEEGSRLG
jgi:hypothetical protein